MRKGSKTFISWIVTLALIFALPTLLTGCGDTQASHSDTAPTAKSSPSNTSSIDSSSKKKSEKKSRKESKTTKHKSRKAKTSSKNNDIPVWLKSFNDYAMSNSASSKSNSKSINKFSNDSRWPATSSELLNIKKENRWYNAYKHVGENWTVAGRVEKISQTSSGTFVDLGTAYPDPDRFTIVIWPECMSDFSSTLGNLQEGISWIKIRGYISEYNGRPQIDLNDSYTEWTYWK